MHDGDHAGSGWTGTVERRWFEPGRVQVVASQKRSVAACGISVAAARAAALLRSHWRHAAATQLLANAGVGRVALRACLPGAVGSRSLAAESARVGAHRDRDALDGRTGGAGRADRR